MGNFFQLKLFWALILYVEVHHPEVWFSYRQSFIHDWCTLFLLLKCLMWHAVAITGLCRAVCSIGSVWGYIVKAALHCRQWIDWVRYSLICDFYPFWSSEYGDLLILMRVVFDWVLSNVCKNSNREDLAFICSSVELQPACTCDTCLFPTLIRYTIKCLQEFY